MNTTTLLTKLNTLLTTNKISKETTLNLINENWITVYNGNLTDYANDNSTRKVLDKSLVLAHDINKEHTTIYIEEM